MESLSTIVVAAALMLSGVSVAMALGVGCVDWPIASSDAALT
jgi:hypothetical protein